MSSEYVQFILKREVLRQYGLMPKSKQCFEMPLRLAIPLIKGCRLIRTTRRYMLELDVGQYAALAIGYWQIYFA